MFSGFEFIRAYIYDLLTITRGNWSDQLEKLEQPIQKLKINELKYNIKNQLFRNTDMEYIGFWVNRNGILRINKSQKP